MKMVESAQENLSEVKNVLVDAGYTGEKFATQIKDIIGATVEVIKRSELHSFVVLPKRWVVERSFAWLEKCRRLWKNCERKLNTSLQMIVLSFYKDFKQVLRACALTLLNFAIYKGNNECINSILIRAQNSDTLRNILTSKDIVQLPGMTYVIKPIAFAIYKGNNECVNSILIRARNSGMIQDAFTEVSTVLFPYGRCTLNAFELAVVVNENNSSIRTALDNVSISSRYVRENSKIN